MNPRGHMQPYLSNSLAIRQEIQRFESVHPSIYAIYDLIEAIPDPLIQQQIREHVVSIEDSFVNSQEWTLSRSVPDLKLGILGSISSGKSALVHRYLTGSYMQEESPEGGRFKKEVVIDGQSYLLLIRDEGGPPEMQFTHWVDAVIFVFSLENEISFNAIYSYYAKMAHYRNTMEIPLILVGTQDAISESNPRVIDDTRARRLATDLKRCSYYETCATYGLNVERVFQDACQKIAQARMASLTPTNSRPSTPNHSTMRGYYSQQQGHSPPFKDGTVTRDKEGKEHKKHKEHRDKDKEHTHGRHMSVRGEHTSHAVAIPVPVPVPPSVPDLPHQPPPHQDPSPGQQHPGSAVLHRAMSQPNGSDLPTPTSTPILGRKNKTKSTPSDKLDGDSRDVHIVPSSSSSPLTPILSRIPRVRSSLSLDKPAEGKDLPATPSGTPTQSRKNRRRSNLFTQKKGDEDKKVPNGQLGSGRAIPIKQGHLYKKSSKPLNKDWKKKYVTLCDDGRLTYHPSLHDYMDDVHGKEIQLGKTTVKVPGMFKPKGARTQMVTNPNANGRPSRDKENVLLTAYDVIKEGATGQRLANCEDAVVIPNASLTPGYFNGMEFPGNSYVGSPNSKIETPNVKKRHRRAKSGTNKNLDPGADGDSDGYEFIIVSLENKQWHFEAPSVEEREEWVTAIEQQILSSLQCNESSKSKSRSNTVTDPAAGQLIRNTKGNSYCADCDAPSPDWASLNLGALICIECSGIHRNLGTHLTRVRSLDLDEWPLELVTVMTSIGNTLANSIWEANTKGRPKPNVGNTREDKERWIRAKYEQREFLPPPPYLDVPLSQQLIDAVARQDIHNAILVLAYAKPEHVNTPYSKTDTRTALHIAAALGNVVLVQLLLWYGADVKILDHESRNALWYARTSSSQECVQILRNQDCPDNPTLSKRRGSVPPSNNEMLEKLPASVI